MIQKERLPGQSKIDYIMDLGWIPYKNNLWIKLDWIKNKEPYDSMAVVFEIAYEFEIENVNKIVNK